MSTEEITPMPEELAGDEKSQDTSQPEDKSAEQKKKKRWTEFKQRIDINKSYKKKLIRNWTINIDYRRGKLGGSSSDDDATFVNLDWSYTKTKQASLFSQVPKVRVNHAPESVTAGPWLSAFERKLNDVLVTAGIEAAMDEVLPDCINAAGFGVALVAYESLTREKEVPAVDLAVFPPEIQAEAMRTGKLFGQSIPMETVPEKIDSRYTIRRISPADFLWPVDFTGSDFDNAPWLGYTGRLTWAEAMSRFKLTEEDKEKALTEEKSNEDNLSYNADKNESAVDGKVGFDEIFYHAFQYDTEAESFDTINHLVFLHGKSEPVIDEPWQGQLLDPTTGQLIGALKKPLRVLTLAYVSDEDIPPSDSAIARPQINELNKGRSFVRKQRERSMPASWFDVNRLDPAIQQALMRGTWNGYIPVQGDGSRILGTVPQTAIHQENFLFDKIAKEDAQDSWGLGPNQSGVGGDVETKGEASIIQSNFATKVGRERARCASMLVGIGEVVGSLMCLYEDAAMFGEGFDPSLSTRLAYSILADSTVLVDAGQRLDRLNNFLDKYAKSGFISLEPVLKEVATLIGLDPTTVVVAPKPPSPEPPNISLRLTGGDDMMNPLLLAFMLKSGLAPDEQLVEAAKKLIEKSVVMPNPVQPMPEMPPGPPVNVGEANPQAGLLPTIGKRAEGGEGGV